MKGLYVNINNICLMIILSEVKLSEENGSALYFYKSLQCHSLIEDSWIPSAKCTQPTAVCYFG